jgi:hypothetical protein
LAIRPWLCCQLTENTEFEALWSWIIAKKYILKWFQSFGLNSRLLPCLRFQFRGRSQTTFTRFDFFWPPTLLCLHFLWYKVYKKSIFLTTYSPPLLNVVCKYQIYQVNLPESCPFFYQPKQLCYKHFLSILYSTWDFMTFNEQKKKV